MAEYIKRADAMKICQEYSRHCFETNDAKGQTIAEKIEDDIVTIPTADVVERSSFEKIGQKYLSYQEKSLNGELVEVKHGYWRGKPIAGLGTVGCSVCGMAFSENSGRWLYCPNCGAKMGGGKEE